MAAPARIHLTSPAVDYIDNRLQTHRPAFIAAPTHYDPNRERYVALSGTEAMSLQRSGQLAAEPQNLPAPASSNGKGCSALPPPCTFQDIMMEFKEAYPDEPKGRCEKDCSIRSTSSWEEVLDMFWTSFRQPQQHTSPRAASRGKSRWQHDSSETGRNPFSGSRHLFQKLNLIHGQSLVH